MPHYAVKKGRIPGIYETWDECKKQVHKFPNAKYKKFDSREQAILFWKQDHDHILEKQTSKTRVPTIENTELQALSMIRTSKQLLTGTKTLEILEDTGGCIVIDGACKGNHLPEEERRGGVGLKFYAKTGKKEYRCMMSYMHPRIEY